MELNKIFKDGLWSQAINVTDFVKKNITPYEGDASFLAGPTERTKRIWDICLKAIAEERANHGVRAIDNHTVSTITSHKAGYIDRENELIVGLQTDELLKRAIKPFGGIKVVTKACKENDRKRIIGLQKIVMHISSGIYSVDSSPMSFLKGLKTALYLEGMVSDCMCEPLGKVSGADIETIRENLSAVKKEIAETV